MIVFDDLQNGLGELRSGLDKLIRQFEAVQLYKPETWKNYHFIKHRGAHVIGVIEITVSNNWQYVHWGEKYNHIGMIMDDMSIMNIDYMWMNVSMDKYTPGMQNIIQLWLLGLEIGSRQHRRCLLIKKELIGKIFDGKGSKVS
jgi:hypothetical protein